MIGLVLCKALAIPIGIYLIAEIYSATVTKVNKDLIIKIF
jgi:hypothetical protein